MADIACVGILCADVLAKPVETLPGKGLLTMVDRLQLDIGGCAANAAIDLARLGVSASLFGRIGRDDFGTYLTDRLGKEGVDTRNLSVDPDVPTSASIVAVDAKGERSILHCPGANAVFRYENVDVEAVLQAKILFVSGTFLMRDFDGEGAERLLREARRAGVLCCCDTAWDSTGRWLETIAGMLPELDWFLPSQEEAVKLSGRTDPAEMADFFHDKGARNVVVKLGDKGCYVRLENGDGFHVAALTGIPVVDTSGAGDAFCAGFLAGLLRGLAPRQCALLANAAGACCVMEMGTTAGIRSIQETMRLLDAKVPGWEG